MLKTLNESLLARIQAGINKSEDRVAVRLECAIKAINDDQQTVTGQVYAPDVLDSHLEMMEAEDVEYMCHHWVQAGLNSFDIMHDNQTIKAITLESWIARGHPDWDEGAWVMTIKIEDKKAWKRVKSGELGGFSVEAWAVKAEAIVEYTTAPMIFGFTDYHGIGKSRHRHAFVAFLNEDGVVTGGFTSKENGHKHSIKHGTRTEAAPHGYHRFNLP